MDTFSRLLISSLFLLACDGNEHRNQAAISAVSYNTFDAFLDAPFPVADGFDFPFGDGNGGGAYTDNVTNQHHNGWYIATGVAEKYTMGLHTGEDWNGSGGGNSDLGQPVYAVANGRVVSAKNHGKFWGNVVVIEHIFYQNHTRRVVRSVYAHLQTIKVRQGEVVKRRGVIGAVGQDPDRLFPAHLHLEIRWDTTLAPTYWPSSDGKDAAWIREHYAVPSAFIRKYRKLPIPQREKTLVLVDQRSYKMRLYQNNKKVGEYNVSFGQERGRKRRKGDNRTPHGIYYVIDKQRGSFSGDYGGYFGGHWLKINYPNAYDADWGAAQGLITPAEQQIITERWKTRKGTLEETPLGGGIGLHGWIREWKDDGPRHLSWGCVVLHLYDIRTLYDQIPVGSMVVILG